MVWLTGEWLMGQRSCRVGTRSLGQKCVGVVLDVSTGQ